MARYIKANPKVAAYLHLENDRLKLKDGNYILWQGDMTAFGPLPMLNNTLTMIGGIALLPHEAKQEQDGTVLRPLPTATDERFVIVDDKVGTASSADGEAETVTDENVEEQATEAAGTDEQTDESNATDEPTGEGNANEEPSDADVKSETTEIDNTKNE